MTLYDLTAEMEMLREWAVDEDVSEDALNDTLESVAEEFDEKAEGYVFVIKRAGIEAAAVRAQADELKKIVEGLYAKADVMDRRADRIKKALAGAMLTAGRTNIKTNLFSISARKTQAVNVPKDFDIASLPADFVRFPVPKPQADKAKIKEFLQRGGEIAGITLDDNASLTIR